MTGPSCPPNLGSREWSLGGTPWLHPPRPTLWELLFLSSVDLLNIYSLSLPGSLKISPSLTGECLAWDGAGNEAATTGLEELTPTLP